MYVLGGIERDSNTKLPFVFEPAAFLGCDMPTMVVTGNGESGFDSGEGA